MKLLMLILVVAMASCNGSIPDDEKFQKVDSLLRLAADSTIVHAYVIKK